ncbi:Peptide chain release factor 3 [Novipirellula galeiformis]|uniref:Peptide chain release factor 3 n=1 Tax=Novipirellula galeiformis TaxID=2528004 RepID=A0A5C6CGN7_9BACT|nr:peptide chain release factor 3 [Novipirellula galeiformis]TWU22406.1 Peptide chain release factor 3 [Novipirellula galeiformis]
MSTLPTRPSTVARSAQSIAEIETQRLRRRTFAIISHPDAGKTTLTEKLLLFGNSIEIAGAVRGRKSERTAKSDWMEMEQERGISVSSTALTFEFAGAQVNLLDTPGHHDFSEDTYRTLMAADAAVMVIDLAKGIESQTEKLFRVCALRKIPVLTFVNKVDRRGRSPLEILDEIERKFSIEPVPQNWPLGSGEDFRGFVDLHNDSVHLFDEHRANRRISSKVVSWSDLESIQPAIRPDLIDATGEEVELVRMAGASLERSQFLGGAQTPVFFGSALTNFGIEHFLHGFLKLCPPPGSRQTPEQRPAEPSSNFSGFIFKIQANLDPRHRDRVAFLRVCNGMFERDMEVTIARSMKKIRLSRAFRIFGQDRQTIEEAYPGDIIGLVCPGEFRLGDTLCQNEIVHQEGLPQFSPEFFAVLDCTDTARRKQFDRGLKQLIEEGAIQVFHDAHAKRRENLLAAVGELQFDVVRYRLESEYNAPTSLSWRPYKLARWFNATAEQKSNIKLPYSAKLALDQFGHDAVLLQSEWDIKALHRANPDIRFEEMRVTTYE